MPAALMISKKQVLAMGCLDILPVPGGLLYGRQLFAIAVAMFFSTPDHSFSQQEDFVAGLDTLEIDEIVVSGTRVEVARRNVPVTLSLVSGEQIELSNESAVLQVLSHRIPGMFVTERGVTGFGIASVSAGVSKRAGSASLPR